MSVSSERKGGRAAVALADLPSTDRITTPDPSVTSPLGNPNGGAKQNLFKTFFDNYDLQTYINAPHKKWNQVRQWSENKAM